MKNTKEFEELFIKALMEKKLITKEIRGRLLRERVVKKIPILQGVLHLEEVQQVDVMEIMASLFHATILAPEEEAVTNESLSADSLFKNYGVILGSKDEESAEIYFFNPVFDAMWEKIEKTLALKCKRILISSDEFERISSDLVQSIEYKKQRAIRTNEELELLPKERVAIVFADELLQKCSEVKASDIHIEPLKEGFRIRMRLNGMLEEFGYYADEFFPALSSRLKLLANLDIAERRETQDGALVYKIQELENSVEVSFRISVMPTIYGEKIVLRRLSSGGEVVLLHQLGMSEKILQEWERAIKRPHGIVLVSGPTGSGKSTTLFAAINEINKANINITTVEDPVEFKIPGVNQVQIDSHKVSFARALRSILRQDPDVIMLGEIRDQETAEVALRASLTGHMVFSTIHTNDAPSSVTRLIDMGIEPFLVASSVVGVLAQRLVRVLCDNCKEEYELSNEECDLLELKHGTHASRSKGCRKCNGSGYTKRQGVYELLIVDDTIRKMINKNQGDTEIRSHAINQCGMQTILQSATSMMLSHTTSFDEVMRIAAE